MRTIRVPSRRESPLPVAERPVVMAPDIFIACPIAPRNLAPCDGGEDAGPLDRRTTISYADGWIVLSVGIRRSRDYGASPLDSRQKKTYRLNSR